MPASGAACSGRALRGLALLSLALLALVPTPAAAQSCPTGDITLHLIGATNNGNARDPYAVCFSTFNVAVTSSGSGCSLSITLPSLVDNLKWGNMSSVNGADDCPKSTAPLTTTFTGRSVDAVNGALLRAMRKASFSSSFLDNIGVESGCRVSAQMNTQESTFNLIYAITAGSLNVSPGDRISAADDDDEACADVSACKTNKPNDQFARFLVRLGTYTPPRNIRVVCTPGHSCNNNNERQACAAGTIATFPGSGSCSDCMAGSYNAVAGSSHCTPCPGYSHAHFDRATGCLACFFGEPRLVAGTLTGGSAAPLFPNNMPSEQPSPGYRIFQAGSSGDFKAWSSDNPFKSCSAATTNRMLAVETDATCVARVFVLGDSSCSRMDNVAVVQGAYRDLITIASRADDDTSESGGATLELQTESITRGTPPTTVQPFLRLTRTVNLVPTSVETRLTRQNAPSCPEGTAVADNPQSSSLAKACAPCEPGEQCTGNSNNRPAVQCAPGTYGDVWGATSCTTCPNHSASTRSGSTRCQECAAGTTHSSPTRNSCVLCPAGTNGTVPGAGCTNCPAGTYREEDGGDGTDCTLCAPGSWSGVGAKECTSCAVGNFAPNEGSTSCTPCPRGSATNVAGSQECDVCEPGSFADAAGRSTCQVCPDGQITVAANGNGATGCSACPRGTYRAVGATDNKCQSCPAGYSTNGVESGATTCTPCQPGFFSPVPNSVTCTACTGANYTDTPAARACKICPAGTVANKGSANVPNSGRGDASARENTICVACPARSFRPSIMSINTCTVCPNGRETRRNSGATVCQACIPGTTLLNNNDVNCTTCPTGTFADQPGRTGDCAACPIGTFVADTGNQRCDVCVPGSYQGQTGQTACIECPVGTYSEMTGAKALSDCKKAPKGNFADGTGNDGFTPCLAGTFQDKEGQGACKDCPAGNACAAGSVNPRACAPGFFAEPKSPFCRECARGTFQNLGGQRACKPCPAGRYCPNTKMTGGTACPAGTFNRNLGQTLATACVKCPINSFASTTGQQQCQPCGTGQWTGRQTGQTRCWPTSQLLPPASVSGAGR